MIDYKDNLIYGIMHKKLNHCESLFTKQLVVSLALIVALLFSTTAFAQRVETINYKGTKIYSGNTVIEAATAPTTPAPIQGDIWYDTTTNLTKVWDGDSWEPIQAPLTVAQVFSAEYAGASLYADGSDNIGFLTSDNSGFGNSWMNFYHWSNIETDGLGSNDYDIILRFTLPADFEAWEATAIEIDYAGTTDANFTANVYLETSATALASLVATSGTGITTWSVANIPDTGLTTLGAGDTGVIVLHLTATDVVTEGDSAIRVGDITLHYTVNK